MRDVDKLFDPLAPSPEDLVIAKLDGDEDDVEDDGSAQIDLSIRRSRMLRLIARLPPCERAALIQHHLGGRSQRDVAEVSQISQPSARSRIRRAEARLRWLAGTGSLFTTGAMCRAHRRALTRREQIALSVYWSTTSYRAVQHRLHFSSHSSAWQMVRGAAIKLAEPYRSAFRELFALGPILTDVRSKPFSVAKDFVSRRLVFAADAIVAASQLFGTYESYAIEMGGSVSRRALIVRLLARGVRESKRSVEWSSTRERVFVGVRLGHAQLHRSSQEKGYQVGSKHEVL